MTPEQQNQHQLLIESWGFKAAQRYRNFVESPNYMDTRPHSFPDWDWRSPEWKKKVKQLISSAAQRRKGFGDYGNITPGR